MSSIVERSSFTSRVRAGWRWQAKASLFLLLIASACSVTSRISAQPVNDNFVNATPIAGLFGTTLGNTTFGTIEPGEPFHYCSFFACYRLHSVWYRWTAPASGLVTFDTTGTYSSSLFDTIMAAYSGTNVAALTQLASNDDYFSLDSLITFPVTAGTEYHIAVDGYGGGFGPFRLNWTLGNGTNALTTTNEIAFSSATYTVNENLPGFVTITLVSGGGFDNDVTVDYFTTDGTAVAGTDYRSASNTVTFSPGDTIKTFTIPILDNALQNSNKTIFLTLTNPTGGAALGMNSNAVVTIIDDETPPFISAAGQLNIVVTNDFFIGAGTVGTTFFLGQNLASVVTEDETFESLWGYVSRVNERSTKGALVTVTRTAPASGRILVDYYTTNTFFNFYTNIFGTNIFGTNFFPFAQPGLDYQPVSGTLVFDDYQMMANFIVPVYYQIFALTSSPTVLQQPLFFRCRLD